MRFIFYVFIVLNILSSCIKDEEYTTSTNDVLYFSTDTINFDTIISGIPTNTYTFTVYNKASKAIRIPKIYLEKGAESVFKVTIDGMPIINGMAEDFEISANDSMIVYLFANIPFTDSDSPIKNTENLFFMTQAGSIQKIVLNAYGQSVISLNNYRVTEDEIFDKKRPYHILDSLVIDSGTTLTINPGCRLYFHPKSSLIVHGTLNINGTQNSPITLRGDRLGNMFAGQPYDKIPGQWGGIIIKSSSYNNKINYSDIHSGNFGIQIDSSDINKNKLILENSIVHNTTKNAIDIKMSKVKIGNSQLTNAGSNCMLIRGGDVSIIHCTIARFFIFTGGNGVALNFSNFDGPTRLPLKHLYIANSIITGYQDDEIFGTANPDFKTDDFNYSFINCLLNTPISQDDDSHFTNCFWDNKIPQSNSDSLFIHEKNFFPEPNLDKLTFSFQLSSKSKAIKNANKAITSYTYPMDRLGRSREQAPDIGCYQYFPEKDQ